MDNGLYEKVFRTLSKDLLSDEKLIETRNIDNSDLDKVLSVEYEKLIRNLLISLKDRDEKIEKISKINEVLGVENFDYEDSSFKELLLVHDDEKMGEVLKEYRPRTSIAHTSLFTGSHGPSLVSELKREIRTADEIDFLISFIKFSGIRLIYDDLLEFTKTRKLRIITSSYMAASDYKAILNLAKLPNTEIKISYDTKRTRLHAKAYHFRRKTGFSTAYIGSSNLSNPAISDGLEWNVKLSEYTSRDVLLQFEKTFEGYWNDEEFKTFNPSSNLDKKELKTSLDKKKSEDGELVFFELRPYSHQKEILEDLRVEREEYNSYRNLVVAATGTGKTMVAAFDYKEQIKNGDKNLLFLAHRKEILNQSLYTFRNVLKDQNFGEMWVDGDKPVENTHVFASIQSLISSNNFESYSKDYFDYIVIDESHHTGATSYLKVIDYFKPQILLGLTATPERMDGENILEHFNDRIASEIRLSDAIDRKLLCPFHYFAITDPEDLSHLKWTRGGYDINELENVYTKSKQRVQVILDSMNTYLKDISDFKALGFCVSIKHADFMAKSFNKAGIPSLALHSESKDSERKKARKLLMNGEINCIFTVDLFNEGVDIPEIDTVLFLRPTQSLTVFTQQLGRGLRLSSNKEQLTVLDFVGQAHENYDFSGKLRTLVGRTRRGIGHEIEEDFPNMPAGCHIKLEKIARDYILRNIQADSFNVRILRNMVKNFSLNFTNELNLRNFLDNYRIDRDKFYSRYSFYKILHEVGFKEEYRIVNKKELKNSLRRFAAIDSKNLLCFSEKILTNSIESLSLNHREEKMLAIFHYTIWGDKPLLSYRDSLKTLKESNPDLVGELLEIIDYNKRNIRVLEEEYDSEIPLDIHASYTLDQILAAFGRHTEKKKTSFREGVLYIKERNTDLLFITINKSEEDYLATTMYNDYAINRNLFHWESQSTTGVNTPTGQRYISRADGHKVLLFVREYNKLYNNAAPYVFLGNARYLSHEGDRPIEIIWKMDKPIPEKILTESNLRAVR